MTVAMARRSLIWDLLSSCKFLDIAVAVDVNSIAGNWWQPLQRVAIELSERRAAVSKLVTMHIAMVTRA